MDIINAINAQHKYLTIHDTYAEQEKTIKNKITKIEKKISDKEKLIKTNKIEGRKQAIPFFSQAKKKAKKKAADDKIAAEKAKKKAAAVVAVKKKAAAVVAAKKKAQSKRNSAWLAAAAKKKADKKAALLVASAPAFGAPAFGDPLPHHIVPAAPVAPAAHRCCAPRPSDDELAANFDIIHIKNNTGCKILINF